MPGTGGDAADADPGSLRAVPEPSEARAAGTHAEDHSRSPSPSRSRMVPALIAALGIVMLLFGWQSMRAEGLEGQVDGLTADLAVATEEIRAHEQRLGLVRTHVDDLAGRVATLQDLVAE